MSKSRVTLLPALAGLLLAACGGGGDSAATPPAPPPPPPPPPGITWTPGSFLPSSTFAAQCQVPRTGTNPATGSPYPDIQGSSLAEKHFLRAWNNDLYLWFDEVTDRDPASITGVEAYFDVLRTTAIRPSGREKDEFHFTYDTAEYQALSQSGTSVDYGISWELVQGVPPRRIVARFVQAGSQAANAGITRGAELLNIDGLDFVNEPTQAGVLAIIAALFEPASGSSHTFIFRNRSGATINATMTAAAVTYDPAPVVRVLPTVMGDLGYLLFNDHAATAEQALMNAISQLQAANVQDLVLDLRYNGGGYLDIASGLAYMIAGPGYTAGKTFEKIQFNSKHPATNPVTGQPLQPVPFHSHTRFTSGTPTALPTLNLPRVYVLTSAETCSASEAIINGLRGAGVQVYQFGGVTCGKPYGFYPRDNCGTTYFSIQFSGVNELGFGDYAEGFAPHARTGVDASAQLPGCAAPNDDFTHDLGDPDEARLRVAVEYYATGGMCIATATSATPSAAGSGEGIGPAVVKPSEPWRNNRILR